MSRQILIPRIRLSQGIERSPYGDHVLPTSTIPLASNLRTHPDERYHHDPIISILRREHDEKNAKILAEAQARYQAAVAERESRELARRRQRSQEKATRFEELVLEERERINRDSWTRDREEKERMAERREFEAKSAIRQIEEIAAERLKRIQDEDRRVQEMERRSGNGRNTLETNGQLRTGGPLNRDPTTGFPSLETETSSPEKYSKKREIERMAHTGPEGMDVDSPEAGPSRFHDATPTNEMDDDDPMDGDDPRSSAAITNGNGKASKPPKQEYVLPEEQWPTKGVRNKDGSYRKKPGPPKGIKKPPPKNRPVHSDEMARRALLHSISGTVDNELLEAASEAESSIAGSARNTSKRRKLQHAAAELDDSSSESGVPIESIAGGHRSEFRSSPHAYDAVDDELDELYNGEPRGRDDGLDEALTDADVSRSHRRDSSREKAVSWRRCNSVIALC